MDELTLEETCFELDFHPAQDVVATGLIDGVVLLHLYAVEGHEQLLRLPLHSAACRAVLFSRDGGLLYTGGADHKVAAVDRSGREAWAATAAHPVNSLCNVSDGLLASGDDEGAIKVWDVRTQKPAMKYSVHTDFISSMCCPSDCEGDSSGGGGSGRGGIEGASSGGGAGGGEAVPSHLLAASGDGTLSVYDLRQRKLWGRSDEQEDELLSLQIIKGGRKVVCGSQNGVLVVWSWGIWGDCSDRFPGHPLSIDAMLKVDESTVLTGSSDGFIRVVTLQPDRFLGLLGDHDGFPVESLRLSRDKAWIGSVSHDDVVRFWDASILQDDDDDDDKGGGEEEKEDSAVAGIGGASAAAGAASGGTRAARRRSKGLRPDGQQVGSRMENDEDSDADSDDLVEDEAEESDEESKKENAAGDSGKGGMDVDSDESDSDSDDGGGRGGSSGGGRAMLSTAAERFFADL